MRKRALSWILTICMLLSLTPGAWTMPVKAEEGDSEGTKDSLGISMKEWTSAEKAEAEAAAPFGGYGKWRTILEKSELFVSMGYDSTTRLTGVFDWNETDESLQSGSIGEQVKGFSKSGLTSRTEKYRAVETAAMDLYGTGKNEYVARLGYSASNGRLELSVTDAKNNQVGSSTMNFDHVGQLGGVQTYQIKGAFAVTAGDFDGDGKDTILVYIPRTGAAEGDAAFGKAGRPFIAEYEMKDGVLTYKTTVSENVLHLLGNYGINVIDKMKNQPMVSLVAEDVDRDGYDELIVTAGMNDVTSKDCYLESQVFIYDQKADKSWNMSYGANGQGKLKVESEGNKRVVWASSTVGNFVVSTNTVSVDYPEILSAGFIDSEQNDTYHININKNDEIGVSCLQVKKVADKSTANVICEYEEIFNKKIGPNAWTKGGFFESEDVNALLQVQALADQGLSRQESVFISGSLYRVEIDESNDTWNLKEIYKHDDFSEEDKGASGDGAANNHAITNTNIATVVAGNFNGNNEGREQLLFVTALRRSGKNNSYSRVYCYYNDGKYDDNGNWTDELDGKRSSKYLTSDKGSFYINLNAVDTDDDSVIAKLKKVDREYSSPNVMAILESSPYFAEVGDGDVGNSETIYGTSKVSGSSKGEGFGFTAGVFFGYESEGAGTGGGFEVAVDNALMWTTTKSTTTEWGVEFKNDTGDNLVVVYRCPVVVYTYEDKDGKELVFEKVGQPATAMISVEEYNEAAAEYNLEEINESNANLATPGDPASYRKTTDGLTKAMAYDGSWAEYSKGTTAQSLTMSTETEKSFDYDLNITVTVYGKKAGFKAGGSGGFAYHLSKTSMNGNGVVKSGTVNANDVENYDFQWKFVAWDCEINDSVVPVVGYLVNDVTAPPSPGMGLAAESVTTDSVTLCWEEGIRPAAQYRIYRMLDTTDTPYVLVGAVDGDRSTYTIKNLQPNETYTYIVRGVGYNEAGEVVESVDSTPVTVRTQSKDNNVVIQLFGTPELTGSTIHSSGALAQLSAQVQGNQGSTSYQWQILRTDDQTWTPVSALKSKEAAVSGSTGSTMKLTGINKSLDGSRLRCVVTVVSPAGDVERYYTTPVTLLLDGLDTRTTLTVSGASGGSGTIDAPYTGTADHATRNSTFSMAASPVTVTQDNVTYTIYRAANGGNYVATADNAEYYAVTAAGGVYTLGELLTAGDYGWYTAPGAVCTLPTDFSTDQPVMSSDQKKVLMGCVLPVDDNGNVQLYPVWYDQEDGQYYDFANGNACNLSEDVIENLHTVWYVNEENGIVILEAEDTAGDGYDHYAKYTFVKTSDTGDEYTEQAFYGMQDTKLYTGAGETRTAWADSVDLEVVTEEKQVATTVVQSVSGTPITLTGAATATGTNVSAQMDYVITNTENGVVYELSANNGTPVTWTAPAGGLYRIAATVRGTVSTKPSTDSCYYFADDPDDLYRLVLRQGTRQVTELSYDGQPIALELQKRTEDLSAWTAVESNVSYKAGDSAVTGTSFTPNTAGIYILSAVVEGKTVATAQLTVNKVPITITPVWDGGSEELNTVPAYSDISLRVTGAEISAEELAAAVTFSCGLYDDSTHAVKTGKSGVYTVTPVYTKTGLNYSTEVKTLLSRYTVTLQPENIYYFAGAATVRFDHGENGTLSGWYQDMGGTEFPFLSGSQISVSYPVKFTAAPAAGYAVDSWTVKVDGVEVNSANYYTTYGSTLEFTETGMKALENKTLSVSVTFVNNAHRVTFAGGTGGTLTAAVGSQTLTSGSAVTHDAAVTFTARPDEGKMVEKWTVDGETYLWDGTEANYRENELTLEHISADCDVQVSFVEERNTTIYVNAVDTNGRPTAAAVIALTDAKGNELHTTMTESGAAYIVPQSMAVTLTATLDNESVNTVKEWRIADSAVKNSGGQTSITIYEHSGQTRVDAVIATAQTYQLTWRAQDESGYGHSAEGVKLDAAANGVGLGAGSNPAYITADFVLTLPETFELVRWSDNVTVDPADNMKATLPTLEADTDVVATIRRKPTVTVNYSVVDTGSGDANGTLSAKVGDTQLESGGAARYDQAVTFTAAADEGFRVKEWRLNGQTWSAAGTEREMTLNLSEDMVREGVTVTVQFMPKGDKLYFTAGEHGRIESVAVNGRTYDFASGLTVAADAQVVVTAKPDTGYEVKEWLVDGKTVDGEKGTTYTYTAGGETGADISVVFQPVEYSVSWSAQNGTVTAQDLDGRSAVLRGGTTVVFTAVPADGFQFDHWTVNGEMQTETSAVLTWTVPLDAGSDESYAVRAVFARENVSYTVSYSAGANGTVAVRGGRDGQINVHSGDSLTFTAAPDTNYMVKEWKLDGVKVAGSENKTSYTLENIMAAHEVTVEFKAAVLYQVGYAVEGENGTLTAAVNGEGLVLDPGVTKGILPGSSLTFTASPADGFMLKQWTVNGTPVTAADMNTMGLEMVHELSNVLTIKELGTNVTVKAEFEPYVGHAIPADGKGYTTAVVERTPNDTLPANEIRRNGDVAFKVDLAAEYSTISKLVVNGYDCIAGKLAEESVPVSGCDSVSAVKNGDGSYTVTVKNVTAPLTAAIEAHKLVVGALTVPDSLAGNAELNTPEKLQNKLALTMTGSKDDVTYFDIALKYHNGSEWVTVSHENFPAGGVDVFISYEELGSGLGSQYSYEVIHMFTADMNGHTIGETERIIPRKTAEGITFHVDSLSPFAIGWKKSSGGTAGGAGGGGGIAAAEETVVVEKTANGTITVSDTEAVQGDTVTITVKPDTGYTLETLTVLDQKGKEISLVRKGETYTFLMPDGEVTVKATFMEDNTMLNFFVDVHAQDYYYDAVLWAVKNGITSGVSQTHFGPEQSCTRAQIVTFLWKAAGAPEPKSAADFTDVPADAYYAKAVAWAVENGVTSGMGEGKFGPDAPCTRAQAMTFLYNAKGKSAVIGSADFTDVSASAYYAKAVAWAVDNGVTSGVGGGQFGTDNVCTRAQIVTFLYKAYAG